MKFFTKDWYLDMQRAGAFSEIRSNAKAAEFSEEFYQKQYEKWIKEQLDYEKKVSKMSFEKLFPAPAKADLRFVPKDEVKKLKDEFAENLPEYKKMYAERPEYDENRLRSEYAAVAREEEERVLSLLPDEIKSKIADTRQRTVQEIFSRQYGAAADSTVSTARQRHEVLRKFTSR